MPEGAEPENPKIVVAFDFGLKRIGIASGDTLTRTANPRATLANGAQGPDWIAIDRLISDLRPARLAVGEPYNADGSPSALTESARRFAEELSRRSTLPVHLVDKISRMRRVALKLQEEFGREPTDEELAEEMGMTPSRVAQMRTAAIRPASLDAPIGDDDSNNYSEIIADENADTPYEQLEDATITRMLQEMVKTLD